MTLSYAVLRRMRRYGSGNVVLLGRPRHRPVRLADLPDYPQPLRRSCSAELRTLPESLGSAKIRVSAS
jgi:hypothetical protein